MRWSASSVAGFEIVSRLLRSDMFAIACTLQHFVRVTAGTEHGDHRFGGSIQGEGCCPRFARAGTPAFFSCFEYDESLSRFVFSSAYVPGQPDESAFVAALKRIMSRDPEVAELAILRRLLHESYALSALALKQIAEQTEDGPALKLSQPERAERLQKQQSRITGLQIQGVYNPPTD